MVINNIKPCFRCEKCGQHWGGDFGENNAKECCKFLEYEEILKKREYWKNVKCDECGERMVLDLGRFRG